MAENKKSFILYADLINSIDHLTNEEKGILFNHLLEYVNDKNPKLEDRLILTAWKPIELQLKRDLVKFEEVKEKRSEAGKRSAELRALNKTEQTPTNSTSVESVQQTSTNPTDNDTVNVNVNVNDNVILLEKETKEHLSKSENDESVKTPEPEERKKVPPKKESFIPPEIDEFLHFARETYQNELKRDFSPFEFAVRSKYESWDNAEWKDGNGKQIKNWKLKLKNTIPHLKPIYNGTNNYTAGATNGNYQKPGKTSARTVLAQRLNAANAANGQSGNITIDIEAQ